MVLGGNLKQHFLPLPVMEVRGGQGGQVGHGTLVVPIRRGKYQGYGSETSTKKTVYNGEGFVLEEEEVKGDGDQICPSKVKGGSYNCY